MYQLILIFHVFISVALIGLVLIQHGKGADIGAAFGSGASQTVFGSQGSGSFLIKITGGLAAAFFTTSLMLGYLATTDARQSQRLNFQTAPAQVTTKPVTTPAVKPANSGTIKVVPVKKGRTD